MLVFCFGFAFCSTLHPPVLLLSSHLSSTFTGSVLVVVFLGTLSNISYIFFFYGHVLEIKRIFLVRVASTNNAVFYYRMDHALKEFQNYLIKFLTSFTVTLISFLLLNVLFFKIFIVLVCLSSYSFTLLLIFFHHYSPFIPQHFHSLVILCIPESGK